MSDNSPFIDLLKRIRRSIIRRTRKPAVGAVDLGDLDRVTPVSADWGFDRGTPVDRHYIEAWLSNHSSDVRGVVLEVANNTYTLRFGGDDVRQSDILHNTPDLDRATIVLDLVKTDEAPADRYDCIICTQTLHLIYDLEPAIQSLWKMLKPGGVLLLTAPTITQISRWDFDRHGDNWRFTSMSLRKVFEDSANWADLALDSYGNVYAATAFLHGLAAEELDQDKLAHIDPDYEMLHGLRATKPAE